MKDIAEECAILNTEVMLADKVRRLAVDVPEDLKVLSLLTDVFDCFFRFMAAILVEHEVMEQDSFWLRWRNACMPIRRIIHNWPINLPAMTSLPRNSPCPASTGCSWPITSRWWTWPIRPVRYSLPVRW